MPSFLLTSEREVILSRRAEREQILDEKYNGEYNLTSLAFEFSNSSSRVGQTVVVFMAQPRTESTPLLCERYLSRRLVPCVMCAAYYYYFFFIIGIGEVIKLY